MENPKSKVVDKGTPNMYPRHHMYYNLNMMYNPPACMHVVSRINIRGPFNNNQK